MIFTFKPAIIHNDSVSTHRDSFIHRSNIRDISVLYSDDLKRYVKIFLVHFCKLNICVNTILFIHDSNTRSNLPNESYLPCSKWGAAMGDSSTFRNIMPSDGRACFGGVTSQETWAITLWHTSVVTQIVIAIGEAEQVYWFRIFYWKPETNNKLTAFFRARHSNILDQHQKSLLFVDNHNTLDHLSSKITHKYAYV